MTAPPVVEAIPVAQLVPPAPQKTGSWLPDGTLPAILGWLWRYAAGVYLCCNVFPLSFVTSVAVFGWLQRWTQAVALRGWWRASPQRPAGTFHDFCDALGHDGPVPRPRWFWRERAAVALNAPGPDGRPAGVLRTFGRLATLPLHSLGRNFGRGVEGLFTTYLLTGWGCLLMLFSWYFGWFNSFGKGYEDFWLGPTFGLLGSFVLVASLFYVPMAQAHQAAAGDMAAFFQVRVVLRLIAARFTGYVAVVGLLAFVSLVFEAARLFVLSDDFAGNREDLSPAEALQALQNYWLACTAFFFPALLAARGLAAVVYRSAVLKALRRGTVRRDDLPPRLAGWLDRLALIPATPAMPGGLVRTPARWSYRALLGGTVVVFWLLFVTRFYVGYFLAATDLRGFLNHPVVHLPCIDWTPWHLLHGRDE